MRGLIVAFIFLLTIWSPDCARGQSQEETLSFIRDKLDLGKVFWTGNGESLRNLSLDLKACVLVLKTEWVREVDGKYIVNRIDTETIPLAKIDPSRMEHTYNSASLYSTGEKEVISRVNKDFRLGKEWREVSYSATFHALSSYKNEKIAIALAHLTRICGGKGEKLFAQ